MIYERAVAHRECPPVLGARPPLPLGGQGRGGLAAQGEGGPRGPLAINPSWSASWGRAVAWQGGGRSPPTWHRGGRAYGRRPLARCPCQALAPGPGERGWPGKLSIPPALRCPGRAAPGLRGASDSPSPRPLGPDGGFQVTAPSDPGRWRGVRSVEGPRESAQMRCYISIHFIRSLICESNIDPELSVTGKLLILTDIREKPIFAFTNT